MTLKGMPLAGQGKPLPDDFKYKGQWLHEGLMFIYLPEGEWIASAGSPRATVLFAYGKSDWCLGVAATQLADAFDISVEELFEHNRANTLFLVRADEVPPQVGGMVVAKRYIFQIGDFQTALMLEGGGPVGNA